MDRGEDSGGGGGGLFVAHSRQLELFFDQTDSKQRSKHWKYMSEGGWTTEACEVSNEEAITSCTHA